MKKIIVFASLLGCASMAWAGGSHEGGHHHTTDEH